MSTVEAPVAGDGASAPRLTREVYAALASRVKLLSWLSSASAWTPSWRAWRAS